MCVRPTAEQLHPADEDCERLFHMSDEQVLAEMTEEDHRDGARLGRWAKLMLAGMEINSVRLSGSAARLCVALEDFLGAMAHKVGDSVDPDQAGWETGSAERARTAVRVYLRSLGEGEG